ncbi:MAG: hypothetical protein J6A01_02160 [Proteobacteria bacterium]|nr:hypothetical protein [Pseudomonadota bacterium]
MKARYLATSMLVLALAVGCSKSKNQTNVTQSLAVPKTDVQIPQAETQTDTQAIAEPQTEAQNPVETQTAPQIVPQNTQGTDWQAGTENPLLKLIPDDAAVVIATQRAQDITNKGLNDNLTFFGKEIISGIHDQYIVPEELLADYKGKASEWGLDPQGKLDAVLYVHDGYGVIHVTVTDPEKALERADRWIRNTGKNENVWKNPSWCFMDECKDALVTEVSETHDWHVYRFVMDGRPKPVVHALHLAGNILSFVVFDEGQSLPEHVLEAAKKPLAMNWTEKNSVLAARVDYARLIQVIFKHPYFAEQRDFEFLYALSKGEDKEKIKTISQAESIFSPSEFSFVMRPDFFYYDGYKELCAKEAPLHCTKEPDCTCQEAEDVDCEQCYESENCVWLQECSRCLLSGKCVADRLGKKWLTPQEWLKRIERSSISDDVCIEEGKSVFHDISYSTLDWTVSDDGAFNLNLSTHVSPEMLNNLNALFTEHAEWEERQDHIHGYIAINLENAVKQIKAQLKSITERSWKCSQMRRMLDDIYDIHSWMQKDKNNDELSDIIKDSVSISGSATITDFNDCLHNLQLLTYITASPWLTEFIFSDLINETERANRKIDTENKNYIQRKQNGKNFIFGTNLFSIDKMKFNLKKSTDTFMDITIQQELAKQILERKKPQGKFNTSQNYHLKAYIKDDSFILSLKGTAIP